MASYRRSLNFLALIIILLLIVTACVRPFGSSDEEASQATAEAEVTAQADEGDQTAEPADEDTGSTEADEAVVVQDEETAAGDEEQEEAEKPAGEAAAESDEEQEEATEQTDETASESDESSSETMDEDAAEEDGADTSEEAADQEASADDAATEGDSSMEADSEETAESDAVESDAGETSTTTEPTPLPAVHVVSKGENLFRIGLKYGLSWVPLARYNHIPNPDLIYVGQNIYIPGGQAPPTQSKPESSSYNNYVVKRGDTLFRIGLAFGVSPDEIVEANGIVNANRIYAGQVLKIPTGTP